jgi:hypothetical protein
MANEEDRTFLPAKNRSIPDNMSLPVIAYSSSNLYL